MAKIEDKFKNKRDALIEQLRLLDQKEKEARAALQAKLGILAEKLFEGELDFDSFILEGEELTGLVYGGEREAAPAAASAKPGKAAKGAKVVEVPAEPAELETPAEENLGGEVIQEKAAEKLW